MKNIHSLIKQLKTMFTFIIRITVLTVIENKIKYSKPVELTRSHILYLMPFLFSGTKRCNGFAFMAKSIQDF